MHTWHHAFASVHSTPSGVSSIFAFSAWDAHSPHSLPAPAASASPEGHDLRRAEAETPSQPPADAAEPPDDSPVRALLGTDFHEQKTPTAVMLAMTSDTN